MKKEPRLNDTMPWHNMPIEACLKELNTTMEGLSRSDITQRKEQFGPNILYAHKRKNILQIFFSQFNNVLIYVLLIAGFITYALGHYLDCTVIVAAGIINAIIGAIQESRAEIAIASLQNYIPFQAIALREGIVKKIKARSLLPGDIIFLHPGDRIPADCRLIEAHQLHINEAVLTGESFSVEKNTATVGKDALISEQTCMVFSGTHVIAGQGKALVVKTAMNTQMGHISRLLFEVKETATPLSRKMGILSRWLTFAVLVIAIMAFCIGYFVHEHDLPTIFLAAVAIAVAAIPEGLPAIITITLAIGVRRMAERHAIIRHLPAVEAIGSVTVICTDKTGTLTLNEMNVQNIIIKNKVFSVSGVSYSPQGTIWHNQLPILPLDNPTLHEIAYICALCNDSTLHFEDNSWKVTGDPMEGALLCLAAKMGIDLKELRNIQPRVAVFPFDPTERLMMTLHAISPSEYALYVKGAPESLLKLINSTDPYWHKAFASLATSGQRILAFAKKKLNYLPDKITLSLLKDDVEFLGCVGISDPPRPEAISAIELCHQAGIKVKMITGDHVGTAQAIGSLLKLGNQTLTGTQIESMTGGELNKAVNHTDIFARTDPAHKLKIVQALQQNNEIVAMTGDGVNDAPALKQAEIGIAMGKKGTDVARESSQMVLTDDNFASIAQAVKEGRGVFENLRKAFSFIIPTDIAEASVVLIAVLFGAALPISPLQILWVNLITAVTLSLPLAFEKPEADIMKRPPRQTNAPFINQFLKIHILFVSCLLTFVTLTLFFWERIEGAPLQLAQTAAVNGLIACQIGYLVSCRSFYRTMFSLKGLLGNPYIPIAILILIIFQYFFTYHAFLQSIFGTQSLSAISWLKIIFLAALVFFLIEAKKYIIKRFWLKE